MKNVIYLAFILILSCINTKETINNKDILDILNENITQYFQTNNKTYLQSAYKSLRQNKDYKKYGLTVGNSKLVISLLMNLKKYDELERLLKTSTVLNKYNRLSTLNIVKYLRLKNIDKEKAEFYIKKI